MVVPFCVGPHRVQRPGEPAFCACAGGRRVAVSALGRFSQAQSLPRWVHFVTQIEEVEAVLSLPHGVPVPEACFADNSLTIRHDASGTELRINAVDALRSWHSRQSRIAADAGGVVCATSFDWAYENEYDGLLVRGPGAEAVPMEGSPRGLPMELLRLREDIVWSCHLSLYEDDLHDMGVSDASMPRRPSPAPNATPPPHPHRPRCPPCLFGPDYSALFATARHWCSACAPAGTCLPQASPPIFSLMS